MEKAPNIGMSFGNKKPRRGAEGGRLPSLVPWGYNAAYNRKAAKKEKKAEERAEGQQMKMGSGSKSLKKSADSECGCND